MIGGKVVDASALAALVREVDQLLLAADVFDGCAGHVIHVARTRGWPALSADPASSVGV